MLKRFFMFQLASLFFVFSVCFIYGMKEEFMEPTEKLLSGAIEFHGHMGPYLVLGLKAGLCANRMLGRQPMITKALIKTQPTPPQSCFADGVQFSTGCTYGKGNISLVEGEGVTVTFENGEKKLILKLKKGIIEEINSLPSQEEAWENLAKDFYLRETEDIFEIIK